MCIKSSSQEGKDKETTRTINLLIKQTTLMKRFLLEVGWRLSLVAMVLLCSLFQARGQEEKVMHKVYTYAHENVVINCPSEIADGEDLYFSAECESGSYFAFVFHDGMRELYPEYNSEENSYCLRNVQGPVLLEILEETIYEVDGLKYKLSAWHNAHLESSNQPGFSSLELKSSIAVGDEYYEIRDYTGQFNYEESIASIIFPNTHFIFYPNSMNVQSGLREIHATALNPNKYENIEEAFGDKDLSEVTVYVLKGCAELYAATSPWNRFKEVIEEDEIPTEYPVYLIRGKGVASYTPTTIKAGEDLLVDYTLEDGFYIPFRGHSILRPREETNCDQLISIFTYLRYIDGEITYYLHSDRSEAVMDLTNLSSDIEELTIPGYVTYEGKSYRINMVYDDARQFPLLKKLTLEGVVSDMALSFQGCTALREIHCKNKNPSALNEMSFSGINKESCIVYVPKGCVEAYKASSWGMFTNIVEEGTVVNTNSIRIEHNPFDTSYLQAGGLDTNPSETAFIYQSEEGAEADVLMRYTIRNYDQWKGHVAISYWEDMSTYGSGQNWIQADISPEGVFEIKVSKDYIADNGQDMFYNNLRVYADQTGELLYDIQAYTNEQLALEAKDNVMTFINPISFTCGLDTIKGTVGKKIQVPITVGEVSSDLAGKEFRIDGDFWLPVDGEGKFHVYKPDGGEVNLVQTGAAGDPAQCIIMSDKDGILMGRLESNQTYTLTLVSDMEISDFHFNMISFQPMADGKDINGTNWTSPYIIDSTKVIEADSTVTDIEVETITIKAETETQITVNFEGVTSGELIVSSETNVNLNLSGDNNLGDVTNNGTLTIQTSTDVTLNATITNNGTLIDETGLITDVAGSAALNIGQMADAEVEDGGTVTLTASANIEIGVTITFQWQRLLNGVWTNVEENGTNARLLRSTSETSTLEVASADAGEYRCLITSAAPVGDTETRAASTTLAAYATVTVTESVEPEPEPEPAYYTVTLPVVEGATIEAVGSTSVKEGESFSFTVTLKDGYVAADMVVKANGVTLTPDASGRYTIANVRSDVVITVTGIEPDPAVGVEDVETSGLKVWSAAGNLHIQTPEADRAYIVTFGGRVYKILELPAGETVTPMPRGAYINVSSMKYKCLKIW